HTFPTRRSSDLQYTGDVSNAYTFGLCSLKCLTRTCPSFAYKDQPESVCLIYMTPGEMLIQEEHTKGFKLVTNTGVFSRQPTCPDDYELDNGTCFKQHCNLLPNFYITDLVCAREGAIPSKFTSLEQMVSSNLEIPLWS